MTVTEAVVRPPEALPDASRWRSYKALYVQTGKTSIANNFQYRASNYFYMIGMVVEPVVYLVVWSTIAAQPRRFGRGYTPGTFAAYYIVWTLVRNMNIVFTPFGWEWRVKEGQLSGRLLRPVHPDPLRPCRIRGDEVRRHRALAPDRGRCSS